jgi:hypothetical protein
MKPIDVPTLNIQEKNSSRATFRRNGNTYVINNSKSSEDVDDIHTVIDNLYDEIIYMAWWSDLRADIYNIIDILSAIFIIIAGSVVGVLGITNTSNTSNTSNSSNVKTSSIDASMVVVIVLGFSVTTLKSLVSVFNVKKRSFLLKEVTIKLRKISRDVKGLKNIDLTNVELLRRIDEFYTDIDELDMTIFSNGNVQSKPKSDKSDTVISM